MKLNEIIKEAIRLSAERDRNGYAGEWLIPGTPLDWGDLKSCIEKHVKAETAAALAKEKARGDRLAEECRAWREKHEASGGQLTPLPIDMRVRYACAHVNSAGDINSKEADQ